MLYSIICLVSEIEPQVAVIIITSLGVAISFFATKLSYRSMKQKHEERMATKEDVKVVDDRMTAYIKSHKELHAKDDKRFDEMFNMVQFLYQTEINKRK